MKKSLVASGFLSAVASLLGVCAVGCSAETGDPGAQIGSTEQAIHGSAPVVAAANTAADMASGGDRQFAAQCVIHADYTDAQSNHIVKDLWVIAGGFNSAGTALKSVRVYDPGADTWTSLSSSAELTNARGYAQAIQLPGASNKCAIIGGSTALSGSAGMTDVDILTVSTSDGSFSMAAGQPLQTGRFKFGLEKCNDKVIVVGGESENGATITRLKDAEVSTTTLASGTAWSVKSNLLSENKFEFGFVRDPNSPAAQDRYLVTGGAISGGQSAVIEVIKTATANSVTCSTVTRSILKDDDSVNDADDLTLTNAVQGNVAFPEGSAADIFVSAAGAAGSTRPTATDKLTVTDWSVPKATKAAGTSLQVGTHLPVLVGPIADATSPNYPAFMLIGGDNDTSYSTVDDIGTTDAVQLYQSGQTLQKATLNVSRARSVGALIGSSVYVATGGVLTNGSLTSGNLETDKITP